MRTDANYNISFVIMLNIYINMCNIFMYMYNVIQNKDTTNTDDILL